MRAIMTGQVGMDKKRYVDATAKLGADRGTPIQVFHVGDMMYHEAPDVRPGRILDLSLFRLHSLRRAVFKDIAAQSTEKTDVIINTHATFRWRHGLFRAFDFDQMQKLKPEIFVCLLDNIEAVYHRLHQEHVIDATLKDLMVWREEEIMATELLAQSLGCGSQFYILSRGRNISTIETAWRLVTQPKMRKVYPSFPMSHVMDMPEVLAEIDSFRAELANHFISFDPGDVDEKVLLDRAIEAARQGQDFLHCQMLDAKDKQITIKIPVKQVMDIAGDVDGQIYARDFRLIDQSDMIVSLVPELANGVPGLSSGVERELQHAFEGSKEVYVVWKPKKNPSPFITETATKVFKSVPEALKYFEDRGMFAPKAHLFH